MVFINMCKVFMKCSSVTHLCIVASQLQEVQGKKQALEDTVAQLEKSLEENRALLQEKDALIETQSKREKELVAAVQRYCTHSLTPLRPPRSQKHCFWFASLLKDTFYIYKVLGPC